MPLTAEYQPHGRAAAHALATCLASWRAGDPLAPATVVVPRSWVGISLRRLLASGEIDGHAGIANVAFPTLAMLAADIAAPHLAARGTRPLTPVVLGAAVRSALRAQQGVFSEVSTHPSTERAVAEVWRDLHNASPEVLAALAAMGRRQHDAVHLVGSISELLSGYHDVHDILRIATHVLSSTSGDGPPSTINPSVPIAVYVPTDLSSSHAEFLRALGGCATVHLIVGIYGDPEADSHAHRQLSTVLADPDAPLPPRISEVSATKVIAAPDQDTEVRLVLREIAARTDAGTRLERMAVAFTSPSPYARMVTDACEAAHIPVIAPTTRTLGQMVAGRCILDAFAVLDNDWSPTTLQHLVETAPASRRGVDISAGLIARLGAEAGVVCSFDSWIEKLGRHSWRLGKRLEDEPDSSSLTEQIHGVSALTSYLRDLYGVLEPESLPSTWAGWVGWLRSLHSWLIGGADDHDDWPSDQREASRVFEGLLNELADLDQLDPSPDANRFRRAVSQVLERPAPQTARIGHGLVVGPLSTVVGLDLDVLYVVGANDGLLPSRPSSNAVLPDDEREHVAPDLPMAGQSRIQQRQTWLAALAATPERVVSFALHDGRTGRELRPARWALDSLAHLVPDQTKGSMLFSRDLAGLHPTDTFEKVPSASYASYNASSFASAADLDLHLLTRAATSHTPPADHWLTTILPALTPGWQMRLSRALGRYDEFEGRVRLDARPSRIGDRQMSATRIETYAKCPRRYLLTHELGIRVHEAPADLVEIDARDRGTIIHAVLERFFAEQCELPAGDRRRPHIGWNTTDHARLDDIIDETFADFHDRGLTGNEVLWQATAATLRRDLHHALVSDDRYRADYGATPEAVELSFGDDHHVQVEVELADGRVARFHGKVDRVDRTRDGRTIVFDYKTGSNSPYEKLAEDPLKRGQLMQLPLYARAAQQLTRDSAVTAGYWFTSQRGPNERRSIAVDQATQERFESLLDTLIVSIERGDFPARPIDSGAPGSSKPSMCDYCDVKPACQTERVATWERLRQTEELGDLVAAIDTAWTGDDSQ